jgi:hypothetical protein
MDVMAEIRELRRWAKHEITERLIRMFVYTLTAATSELGDGDALEGSDEATDPGSNQKSQTPAVRQQPFGLNSRAPKGLRAFALRMGSSNVFLLGVAPQQKYGAGVDVGELLLYNIVKGCQQLLDKSGNVKIDSGTPDGGAQGDVQVNGGTKKVARVDDTTDNGTLVFNPGSGGASLSFIPPGGVIPPPGPTVNVALSGKINSGADHFKG